MSGIVMDGILKLPAEYLPPTSIKLKGIQQLLRIEQLNRRLNGEAVQVSKYLQADGYACTILKGQGIARYYLYPLHRMPGDIDVWPDAEPDVLRNYYQKISQTNNHPFHIHLSLLKETNVELHFQPSHMFSPFTNRKKGKILLEEILEGGGQLRPLRHTGQQTEPAEQGQETDVQTLPDMQPGSLGSAV